MSIWRELRERSVVRVAALYLAASWLILQVAELLADIYALPDGFLRWLVAVLALGLPAALVLSWLYEWTPEGLRKESEHAAGGRPRTSGSKISLTIAVVLALGVGVYLVDRSITIVEPTALVQDSVGAPPGSIAVIPFANISDNSESDYFADGLSIELLNLLAEIEELHVTGRTSSFRYKDTTLDPREIGAELNVSHLLEGEIRKAGDKLRISVQLVDATTGYQVWQDNYDRTMADVFELQNEIASRTVDGLRVTLLTDTPEARETDPEAFNAFLNARYFYSLRGPDAYAKTVEYLQRGIAIDPEFAPAWTLLASTYMNQTIIGEIEYVEGREMAQDAVERALQVDPDFAFANSARAWQAMYFDNDYAMAGRFFQRALQLAPGSSVVLSNAAVYASAAGQLERAEEITLQSLALDPVSPVIHLNYAGLLNRLGRPTDAMQSANKALELRPGMLGAVVNLCEAYLLAEKPADAETCAEDIPRRIYELTVKTFSHSSQGQGEEAKDTQSTLIDEFSRVGGMQVARTFAWGGDTDNAFEWLERSIAEKQNISGLKTDPMFSSLHDDPRWNALLESLGWSDEQLEDYRL